MAFLNVQIFYAAPHLIGNKTACMILIKMCCLRAQLPAEHLSQSVSCQLQVHFNTAGRVELTGVFIGLDNMTFYNESINCN